MSKRLNQEREAELQPKRVDHAVKAITSLGFAITHNDGIRIEFSFKNNTIKFFPYSGWATGATIVDGRGLKNLLSQLKVDQGQPTSR